MNVLSATKDRNEVDVEMSNFDHVIDDDMEETLKAGHVFGRHSAYNFNGRVWYEDGKFHEEVWRYHVRAGAFSADTLKELMELVNDEWGWE